MNTQTKTQTRPGYAATPSNAPRQLRPVATMQPPPPPLDDFEQTFPPRPRQTPSAPPPHKPLTEQDFNEIRKQAQERAKQDPKRPAPRPPVAPPVTQRAPAAPTLADVMQELAEIKAQLAKLTASGHAPTAAPSALRLTISKCVAQFTNQKGQANLPMTRYYRIMGTAENGGNFTQNGITVYPEVLEAAGIDPAALVDDYIGREVVAELTKLEGRTAYYTEVPSTFKPGTFSRKIIRID